MASTPPTTSILATPPTPKHAGEACRHYSTRQTNRFSAQRLQVARTPPPRNETTSASGHKATRTHRPVSPSLSSASPRSLSSSANTSPDKRSISKRKVHTRVQMDEAVYNSTVSNASKQGVDGLQSSKKASRTLLPTPASLPRKKEVPQREVQAAARVLFPSQPDRINDAMPTPRKNRKSKKSVGFSLYSSMEEDEDDASTNVQVYTDSRDKIPELNIQEDNPFLDNDRRGTRTQGHGRGGRRRKPVREVQTNPHIEKAFNHDKGMVYVL